MAKRVTHLGGSHFLELIRYMTLHFSPHVRKSKTVLDSGFHAVDFGFQELDSGLFRSNLDPRFQSLMGFRIPWAVFQIPKPQIPDSSRKKFPRFRNPQVKISWIPVSRFPYFRDCLYVWTEALSGMVFVPAQKLPKTVLDAGFRIPSTGFWILCPWNLNSGFQSLVGFRIPWAVFKIPKPRISDSTTQFPGFQIPQAKIFRIPEFGFLYMGLKPELKKNERQDLIVPKNWKTKRRHLTFSSRT